VAGRPWIWLVTSAGPSEGRGHLARTVTLAETLREAGARVHVELLRGELSVRDRTRLEAAGAELRASAGHPDAVLVDIPDPNEVAGRWPADSLAIIDDSNRLTTPAAIVVQPSLPAWSGRAPVGTVLAGYAFAPLRASLRRLAEHPPAPSDPPDVFVCFGGGDPDDVTARLVPAVAAAVGARRDSASLTVVVGASYGGRLEAEPGWTLLQDPPDFDERLAGATVALIGGGTLKFEAAHLGVPAIVVAVADDQPDNAEPMAALAMAAYVGDGRTIDPEDVGWAVVALLDDPDRRAAMARAGRAIVDGRGAERIAREVLVLAGSR